MRRRMVTGTILLALASVALSVQPGSDVLSFYFCLPVAALLAMASGATAVTAMAEARGDFRRGLRNAGLAALLFAIVPLGISLTSTVITGPCDTAYGLLFYLFGPVASACTALGIGVLIGAGVKSPRLASAAWILVFVLSFVLDGIHLYRDPAVAFYNPFLGFYPGPIYDERIEISSAYLYFRILCLSIALCALALARGLFGRDRVIWPFVVAGLCFIVAAFMAAFASGLGFRVTREAVEAVLSEEKSNDYCIIRYAPGLSDDLAAKLLQDCAFRHRQAASFFGLPPGNPIRLYVYPDQDTKARLMGARDVDITKPWLEEIHINPTLPGDQVIGHEVAHVVAGRLASGPLHIPLTHSFVPNMGMVEGLAVACAFADDGPSPHELSLAMLYAGIELRPRELFDGLSFVTGQAARSYVAAGSFVRFIWETRGQWAIQELARGEPVETLGSFEELEQEWKRHLFAVASVGPDLLRLASAHLSGPGVLAKRCPVDTARFQAQAAQAEAAGDMALAQRCMEQALSMSKGADAIARRLALLRALSGDPTLDPYEFGDPLLASDILAMQALSKGLLPPPEVWAGLSLSTPPSPSARRSVAARLAVLGLPPEVQLKVFRVLLGLATARPDLDLAEVLPLASDHAVLRYLSGRASFGAGAFDAASSDLLSAIALGLDEPFLAEAEKALGKAAFFAGRYREAQEHLMKALDIVPFEGDRLLIGEYALRLVEAYAPH